ncbi:MAG: sugar ABC transporter ATP-binding protein [Microbacteriaceae bacterium]|nr:sugar ABC transporter ATP-binding protein [Microbacteriaceae bacterium]
MTEPVVEMRGISIEFPGVKALDGVDFRLFPGEVHSLMGENGAGKSTLIKALTGVYPIDAGEIRIAGEIRRLNGTADARNAGIATVYQEVNLCANLSIGENVMLGQEPRSALGIRWKALHAAAHAALERLGLGALDPRAPLSSLSLAVQQLVAIARAVQRESKVLILDEPTSSLDANEVANLFRVIRRLRDEGVAILFVSHFLDQVYAISDRMTILRNGRYEGEFLTKDLDRTALISTMIGKDADALRSIAARRARHDGEPQVVLSATDLGRKGSIAPTDVDLHRGEVVGLAGLLGSGRTELARLLYGADRADTGSIIRAGKRADLRSPRAAMRSRIAYSSENRRDEGIIRDLTVRENLILGLQTKRGWARPIPRREQDELVQKYIGELGIRPADPERPIKQLSGGNQQKVLLGRWLATQPEILILDEPTRGIDIGAKAEIQGAVAALAERGVTVVFISSELEEVVRLSDRILVLKDRRKIAELVNGEHVTADTIVAVIAEDAATAHEETEA